MKNVPKLRFKEFNDELKSELVGNLFSEVRNGFVGTATPYYVEGGVPYLQSNNIRKNRIDTNKMVYITKEFHLKNKKSILKKEDILMVQSGHAGECAVVPSEFEGANCHALIVMTPKKNTNSIYCSYYINSDIGQKKLFKLITGNTVKHILASEIKEFNIKIPKEKEQEKIANFLSKIDKLIEKQEEKMNNLEQYKKCLMQKIFSQEIRFKKDDGGEYPEWKEKKLKQISDVLSGKRIPKGESTVEYNTGVKYITVSDMGERYISNNNIKYITKETEEKIKKYKVSEGDIIISVAGTLGKINLVSKAFDGDNLTENCDKITNFDGCNNIFIYYYLNTNLIQNQIKSSNTISSQPKLALDRIRNFDINIPCIEEQMKIAKFLSNLDSILEKEKEKLEELRKWKKGLLQQMFV